MRAVPPPCGSPRRATRLPRARRQPARRPRRWGRPLAVVLALVLVAALVPGALADTDGGAMPPAPGPGGDDTVGATSEAEALASADTFEDRTLTAPEDSTGTATATSEGTAVVSPTPGSQPEPETSDPDTDGGAVADRAVRAPTQPGQEDRGPEEDAADPSDQAAQDRWRDAGQGCGATGRCPEGPQIPGNLAGAAAAAIGGRPWQPPPDLLRLRPEERARFLDQERQRERQELERLVADPDLELDSGVILEAFDGRWASYAATALAGELQQVRRAEPDPSMTARW